MFFYNYLVQCTIPLKRRQWQHNGLWLQAATCCYCSSESADVCWMEALTVLLPWAILSC